MTDHVDRIAALRQKLGEIGADSWLSLCDADNFYLTGFTGDTGALIITSGEVFFLCDPRFTEQAASECRGCLLEEVRGSFLNGVANMLKRIEAGNIAFDPSTVTVCQFDQISKIHPGPYTKASGLVSGLRIVKAPEEVELIRQASELAEAVLVESLDGLEPGITEMELAAVIEYEFKRRGASGPSFPTIALFGARSSLPHGQPGDRELEPGDIVLIDMGCRKDGYCSDLTRTYSYATISGIESIPKPWFNEIYQVVFDAQHAALDLVGPGARCRDVDAAARGIIDKAGYGKHFGHGLGHGVGIEVHEGPRLNAESEAVLEPGMVVTVEPGIYLPGQGGVRIEDLVVVTDQGCEILSRTPKQLRVLGT